MDHGAAIINTVVYLGNSICGILGGTFAVLGFIVFPFVIIILIFLFINFFQNTDILNNFFIGSLCYIFILIIQSMINLGKNTLVNKTTICIFNLTLVSALFMDIPILVYIIIAGIIGGISRREH